MLARRLVRLASYVDPIPTIDLFGLVYETVEAMDEDAAFNEVVRRRWPSGVTCPRCGHSKSYFFAARRKFKCKSCFHQFTPTSGTMFASRKMTYRNMLLAAVYTGPSTAGIGTSKTVQDIKRRVAANCK